MHHDPNTVPGAPIAPHVPTPTIRTPATRTPATPPGTDLCMSVFDRWRCGLEDGHAGSHVARVEDTVVSWNDAAAGRRLRWR